MILSCKKIEKSYSNGNDTLKVLNNISLDLDKGEIVSIMGESGSGKSTLLNILGTLDLADSGSLFINGKNISTLDENELALIRNKELGFVFQFHHLLPEFTAYENVILPSLINKSEDVHSRAIELFNIMSLSDRMTHYPHQLSGGERQRIAVMRALIQKPVLILADEPTGNLDEKNTEIFLNLIKQICTEFKQSLVIATHDKVAAQIANRQYFLFNKELNVMDNL